MSRKIIAFAGSKGSGKTTAFKAVESEFENVFEITLAGHLKKVCAEVYGIEERYFHDQSLKEKNLEDPIYFDVDDLQAVMDKFEVEYDYDKHIRPHLGTIVDTPRQLLQVIGTNVLHPVDPLIHVNYISKKLPKEGLLIVTDLRFLNEFNYFNEKHSDEFYPFYVRNTKAEIVAEGDTHPSEKQLQLFKNKCELIENNCSLEEYINKVVSKVKEKL